MKLVEWSEDALVSKDNQWFFETYQND